ncbi:MAG: hypothetical protein HW421_2947 [Ignavibacteria bacterium]|nr:hypothetical protein [Ignavibacteria bacterium]
MRISRNKILFLLLPVIFLTGCFIVKRPESRETPPSASMVSPKPKISMSDELVRSRQGDMIAFLPKDWFFVDVENRSSSDVIAVAVNPDYTLSAVFSLIKSNENITDIVTKEGLLGLARISFARHERKTAGAVKLIGNYQTIQIGQKSFAIFEFSSNGGASTTKIAVYKSELNQYYEFALTPMNFTGKPQPTKEETNAIFNSILTSIDY